MSCSTVGIGHCIRSPDNECRPFQNPNPTRTLAATECRCADHPLSSGRYARWRDADYPRASGTSSALLRFWFDTPHPGNFRFFFSQRKAIESIIYLYEVAEARDKYRLIERFDSGGKLTPDAFTENWTRYVVKMATGAGKTKVAALVIVWSYFHKLYEPGSPLSRNFLFIAPNIIAYNRLRKDFEGLRMFHDEPFLPGNDDDRYCNRYWQDDFCPALHLQDNIRAISATPREHIPDEVHPIFIPPRISLRNKSPYRGKGISRGIPVTSCGSRLLSSRTVTPPF